MVHSGPVHRNPEKNSTFPVLDLLVIVGATRFASTTPSTSGTPVALSPTDAKRHRHTPRWLTVFIYLGLED
jgi:hypothetical protein